MDLRQAVAQFVARVKKQPTDGSDPNVLDALLKAARTSLDGLFAAQHAPIAVYTWEVETRLGSAAVNSGRIPFQFGQPVQIVGFLPLVVDDGPAGQAALVVPTVNDLRVVLDTNDKTQFTSRQTQTAGAGNSIQNVSLQSISVLAPRLFNMRLENPQPIIGFDFSWKRAAGTYRDAIVSVAMFCRWL